MLSSLLQVYKTQLERVSEGWKSRIGDFERVNTSLQTEVTKLQLENQDLKSKVRGEGQRAAISCGLERWIIRCALGCVIPVDLGPTL